ncbi:hypothetical protein NKG94_23620 [Micromonospora sp. M12]
MELVLLPFRWVYRALVWFANSPRTLITSYLLMIVVAGVIYGRSSSAARPTPSGGPW